MRTQPWGCDFPGHPPRASRSLPSCRLIVLLDVYMKAANIWEVSGNQAPPASRDCCITAHPPFCERAILGPGSANSLPWCAAALGARDNRYQTRQLSRETASCSILSLGRLHRSAPGLLLRVTKLPVKLWLGRPLSTHRHALPGRRCGSAHDGVSAGDKYESISCSHRYQQEHGLL